MRASKKIAIEPTDAPRVPRYLQVVAELRGEIAAGMLAPGARIPSVVELQARFSIARGTVEKVHARLEKEGLVRRRQGSGIFVAAAPERQASGLIGFVGTAFQGRKDVYHLSVSAGIQQALGRTDKQLLLLNDFSATGWDRVDGVLLFNMRDPAFTLRRLPAGVPCVSLLHAEPGHSSVIADDFGGARLATEHLLALGHRRIACLMEAEPPMPRMRVAGYRAALGDFGIEPDPQWICRTPRLILGPGRNYRQWAFEHVSAWLRSGWTKLGCTALLAQNDVAAIGAIQAFNAGGYEVPERISVIGFDGTDVGVLFEPHLTTVTVPLREIGTAAVELLLQQIAADNPTPRGIVLPTRLEVRHSTATAPTSIGPGLSPRRPGDKRHQIAGSDWSNLLDTVY